MLLDLMQGAKVNLYQHGNDHQPDKNGDRKVHLGDLHRRGGVKDAGLEVAQGDTDNDAERDPKGEVSFEKGHGGFFFLSSTAGGAQALSDMIRPISSSRRCRASLSSERIGRLTNTLIRLVR